MKRIEVNSEEQRKAKSEAKVFELSKQTVKTL
jgi:hypothetical protein